MRSPAAILLAAGLEARASLSGQMPFPDETETRSIGHYWVIQ